MDLLSARAVAAAVAVSAALVVSAAGLGCKPKPDRPVAGLLAAGAALYLETPQGQRPLVVGSQLMGRDRVRATGPTVIEYYGGALVFLQDGDRLTVGEAEEARLIGSNMPAQAVVDGALDKVPQPNRIIAARYKSAQFTPAVPEQHLNQKDYLRAFFTPNGLQRLKEGTAKHEGPRKALPPPPHRPRVPHVRADALGEGGPTLVVTRGYVVAETDEQVTAVLNHDDVYDLGRTVRLILPERAGAKLTQRDGRQVELRGLADVALR